MDRELQMAVEGLDGYEGQWMLAYDADVGPYGPFANLDEARANTPVGTWLFTLEELRATIEAERRERHARRA